MKPTTNRESIDGKLVANSDEGYKHGPGAFWFDDNPMSIHGILPGGNGFGCLLNLPGEHPAWTWDFNREKPTLSPSILVSITWGPEQQHIELWHGYLRNGRFESV